MRGFGEERPVDVCLRQVVDGAVSEFQDEERAAALRNGHAATLHPHPGRHDFQVNLVLGITPPAR